MSDDTKTSTPSWPGALMAVLCVTTAASVFTTCAAKDSERQAWQVRDRENESRETVLQEMRLRHESARECCRQPGVGYATCIEAFGIGAKP